MADRYFVEYVSWPGGAGYCIRNTEIVFAYWVDSYAQAVRYCEAFNRNDGHEC